MTGKLSGFFKKLWRVLDPPAFVVCISNTSATATRGKVSKNFLNACSEIARDQDIHEGKIFGITRPYGISLEFSEDIPTGNHQQFRNAWQVYQ